MNIEPSKKVKLKKKYKTKKERERSIEAKCQDLTRMGEIVLEQQFVPR
jgi:hypothetical protein